MGTGFRQAITVMIKEFTKC